jgi:hypothetical protein
MKKVLLASLALFVVLCSYLVISVHAQSDRPLSFHNAYSYLAWSQGNRGTLQFMSTNGIPNITGGGNWANLVYIETSDGTVRGEAGIEDCSGSQCQYCSSGEHFFTYYGNISTVCYSPVSTTYCYFGVADDNSNGNQINFNIDCGNGTGPCPGWSCHLNLGHGQPAWGYTAIEEDIDYTWGGYIGGIRTVEQNRYLDTSNNWHYQSGPSSCPLQTGCPVYHSGPPPQMYWATYPSDNLTGGILTECERSDGNPVC